MKFITDPTGSFLLAPDGTYLVIGDAQDESTTNDLYIASESWGLEINTSDKGIGVLATPVVIGLEIAQRGLEIIATPLTLKIETTVTS